MPGTQDTHLGDAFESVELPKLVRKPAQIGNQTSSESLPHR